MIAKHIEPKPQTEKEKKQRPYSYKGLAIYIATAPDEGEKLDDFWIVNSNAGATIADLDLAIIDIENTQKLNTRVLKPEDKTYHLMISFRDEKPSFEALKDIESEFAKALGFEKHQRVVGTHINTDNFHMHIAYNKINPETFKCHTPFRDYITLSRVCRDMENKYNLKIDKGFEKTKEQGYEKPHLKAKDFEAITWQQSFYSYVCEKKGHYLEKLGQINAWQDLHNVFEEQGLMIKKRGNGMVVCSIDEKVAIKASDLDKRFSKFALEKKLGKFEESKRTQEVKNTYDEKPLTKHKDTPKLFKKYKEQLKNPRLRSQKQSLLKKAFYHWKDFLMAEALNDPLAMAILVAQRKLLNGLSLGLGNAPRHKKPVALNVPKAKQEKAVTLEKPKQKVYLNIPFKEREEAKKLGAKWDRMQQVWYTTSTELKPFDKWLKEEQEIKPKERLYLSKTFEKKEEVKASGAKYDYEKKSWYITRAKTVNETINKIGELASLGVEVEVPLDIAEAMGADTSRAYKKETNEQVPAKDQASEVSEAKEELSKKKAIEEENNKQKNKKKSKDNEMSF